MTADAPWGRLRHLSDVGVQPAFSDPNYSLVPTTADAPWGRLRHLSDVGVQPAFSDPNYSLVPMSADSTGGADVVERHETLPA
jgi:hypothetical protein